MNERVLELIKNRDLLQVEDLSILNEEIQKRPYIQSIRALYLLGVSKFKTDNYQHDLSTTAAYTTDKKILYHLINGKEISKNNGISTKAENIKSESPKYDTPEITSKLINIPSPVYVDGQLNRILFPGEEEFLNTESSIIDYEATQESGEIVIAEAAIHNDESANHNEVLCDAVEQNVHSDTEISFSKDSSLIKNEEQEKTSYDSSELSFHNTSDFLPNVQIKTENKESQYTQPRTQSTNKHEEEMRKLIEEVEKKLKENKSKKLEQNSTIEPKDDKLLTSANKEKIDFYPGDEIMEIENPIIDSDTHTSLNNNHISEIIESSTSNNSNWKPMNFESTTSKELNGNPEYKSEESSSEDQEESETHDTNISINYEEEEEEEEEEELPVMNVSFFSPTISNIKTETSIQKTEVTNDEVKEKSNVNSFVSTWQSWLKIDRSAESNSEKEKTEKIKLKAIDRFIETEPKISQLKEESSFIVKEKKDDISHLMTETLAKIYVEQRLYSKAIHAYEVLIGKHPDKKDYFKEKIQEIKELRTNP